MQLSLVFLQLAGAVVLLLYSARMVRTGVERAAGPALRGMFMRSRNSVILNVLPGTLAAILLQSSTAVALLVSGFTATGVMGVSGSLSVVLGADLGSAIVVQFLSLDLAWLIPLLLVSGGLLFLKSGHRSVRQIGRIVLGIAFILLSLKMIGEATGPLRGSQALPSVVAYLGSDILTAFAGGALLAFLFHSSVAAVLLFAAFSVQGLLTVDAGIPMVLGANAGGGLVAIWLTRASHEKARRITGGNFMFRAFGALAALALYRHLDLSLAVLGETPARQLVGFHLVFNGILLVVCLPLVIPMARLMAILIPAPVDSESRLLRPSSALDSAVLDNPELALACVRRELLRMSEQIEVMLQPVMDFYVSADAGHVRQVRKSGEELDTAQTEIKLYLAKLNQRNLTPEQARQTIDLTNMTIGLERVGDVITRELMRLAAEKRDKKLTFSDDGWRELCDLHARVMANIQLAMNVLVSEDIDSARQLVEEKERMRRLEKHTHDRHIERLGQGTEASIETSDIHLETVRALKEINSRFATFAYPILEKYGVLRDSRLVQRTGEE